MDRSGRREKLPNGRWQLHRQWRRWLHLFVGQQVGFYLFYPCHTILARESYVLGEMDSEIVQSYLETHSPVHPRIEGRIQIGTACQNPVESESCNPPSFVEKVEEEEEDDEDDEGSEDDQEEGEGGDEQDSDEEDEGDV